MKTTLKVWMSSLAVAGALGLTAGCASDTSHKSAGEVIDDTAIAARLKAALVNDPEIKSSTINTEVDRGTVALSGSSAASTNAKKSRIQFSA